MLVSQRVFHEISSPLKNPRFRREKRRVHSGQSERPVVTDFEGANGRPRIKTASPVYVVSLPRSVGSLHKNVRMAGVIADNKKDEACFAGVQPHKFGSVDPGDGSGR